MSVEVVPGGHRRIDRVLDPRFTDGVEQLDLAELRARREEAEAEEADVSYCGGCSRAASTFSGPSSSAARPAASRTWPRSWPGFRPSSATTPPAPSAPSRGSRCRRGPGNTGAG